MNKHFFITGLPRSRSAWLANLLTWGDSFCFHEALVGCSSMDDLKHILQSPRLMRYVGDADPNLGFVPQSILETFPDCRIVFVHRPIEDCVESEWTAITWDGAAEFDTVTKVRLKETMQQLSLGISHLWKNLRPDRKFMVPFHTLNDERMVREVWNFCLPNTPFNQQRYELLRDLRVTQLMGQVLKRHPKQPFKKLLLSSVKHEAVLENRAAVACGA